MTFTQSPRAVSRRRFIAASAGALAMASMQPALAEEKLNVLEKGKGQTAILFVHGLACGADDWSAQFEALSSKYRCIAPDLPGHGSSPSPLQSSIAGLATSVNKVRRDLGVRKVVLVGHSMGARVIREAYRQAPVGVAGLIFVDSALSGGELDQSITKMQNQIKKVGLEPLVRDLFAQMFLPGTDPQLSQRIIERATKLEARAAADLFDDIIRWDLTFGKTDLPDVAVPALAIQSSYYNDQFKRVPLQEGVVTPFMKLVREQMPRAEIKLVSGVGHFPHIQAADQTNKYIADFDSRLKA